MSSQENSKLNKLLQAIPRNTAVTTARLNELGVSPQLARKYVLNGWLDRLGSGAFSRSGDALDWLGGVYALQSQLGLTVHVAAVSALELQGRAHFVPLGTGRRVILVSDRREALPRWFVRHDWNVSIHHRCLRLFHEYPDDRMDPLECGGFSVQISSPECAILEEMHLAQTNSDLEYAILLMEGLSTLRPGMVEALLNECTSVKAKRLFLWAAKHSQHTWMERVKTDSVDLGRGKRYLYEGGVLDKEYLITVPRQDGLPSV